MALRDNQTISRRNSACVIVAPRQSSPRRDRQNGHPDRGCFPIQIVALHTFVPTMTDERIRGKLRAVIAKLRTFRTQIADFVDESLDKSAFVADLREVIPLLQKTNCWPSGVTIKHNEFEVRLTEFQKSSFVELVDKMAMIVDEADREQIPKLLNALGSLDFGLIQHTMSFLTIADEIVAQAEPRVSQQEAIRGQSDPSAAAAEIARLLEGVSRNQRSEEAGA